MERHVDCNQDFRRRPLMAEIAQRALKRRRL
jgi:hypothetical protein